jgi:hypothetical protein
MSTMNKSKTDAKNGLGGPTSDEGKQRSAANALRHGVLSNKMIVLQSESKAEFEDLKHNYYESLQPANYMEAELVDEMIWAKWRQRRSITSETAAIDMQMDLEKKKVEQKIFEIDDSTRTAHAIQSLVNESKDLALYSRYETRLSRMYHRAWDKLLAMQERRRSETQVVETEAQVVETEDPAPAPQPENKKLPNEPGNGAGSSLSRDLLPDNARPDNDRLSRDRQGTVKTPKLPVSPDLRPTEPELRRC